MDRNDVKNATEKVSNKPFLVVLGIIVLGICVFAAFTLSKAVDNKIAELKGADNSESAQINVGETAEKTTQAQNALNVGIVKQYSQGIENIYITKDAARIVVTVEFEDEEALLDEHYAANTFSLDVAPVFCFYIKNGIQVKLPGELRLLSDGKSVSYYLADFDDLKNALAQTDEVTITLDNIMTNDFNIYIQHKTRDGVGRTILGTYGKSVEEFKASYLKSVPKTEKINEAIKNIEVTSADEFVWLDVYFENEDSYNKFSGDMAQSFMCFGFKHGGKLFKENFIVSEYKSLNMLRLKFDDFALKSLITEMGDEKFTVKQLFEKYDVEIWATDYKNETTLFCLNDEIEIREKLNNYMNT